MRSQVTLIFFSIFLFSVLILTIFSYSLEKRKNEAKIWTLRSIDTVKYSRDLAREKLLDPSFDTIIDTQVRAISELGATHIAIGTPYDSEFIPYLKRWVKIARRYNLKVWFRGNLSGWEGWFGYKTITPEEHKKGVENFILQNPDIFSDGDIFTSCTECENGALNDPRKTGKISEYRNFLISEYQITKRSFAKIGKNVASNYFSMNFDVAKLIMDKETTKALGGVVVIDHYVKTPLDLSQDIEKIIKKSDGKVVLGEFGAPIANIHGNMNEDEQALWIKEAMERISKIDGLIGVNYWTNFGGSTEIWEENGKMRKVGEVIKKYYSYSGRNI